MRWLLIIANVLTSVLCLIFTRQLTQVTMISPAVLVPLILAMAVVGSFADNPDPTLIGPINHRQQASDGPSELSVPWFDNSPEV